MSEYTGLNVKHGCAIMLSNDLKQFFDNVMTQHSNNQNDTVKLNCQYQDGKILLSLDKIEFTHPKIVDFTIDKQKMAKPDIVVNEPIESLFNATFLERFKRSNRSYFRATYNNKRYIFNKNGLVGVMRF